MRLPGIALLDGSRPGEPARFITLTFPAPGGGTKRRGSISRDRPGPAAAAAVRPRSPPPPEVHLPWGLGQFLDRAFRTCRPSELRCPDALAPRCQAERAPPPGPGRTDPPPWTAREILTGASGGPGLAPVYCRPNSTGASWARKPLPSSEHTSGLAPSPAPPPNPFLLRAPCHVRVSALHRRCAVYRVRSRVSGRMALSRHSIS